MSGSRREFFSRRFWITPGEILRFVDYYNNDYSAYDNHVYARVESRIAHWWNYEDHGWFTKRIDIYLDYLRKVSATATERVLLVDIGYSVPYLFAHRSLSDRMNIFTILVDKEPSAKRFFNALSDLFEVHRDNLDKVVIAAWRKDDHARIMI